MLEKLARYVESVRNQLIIRTNTLIKIPYFSIARKLAVRECNLNF